MMMMMMMREARDYLTASLEPRHPSRRMLVSTDAEMPTTTIYPYFIRISIILHHYDQFVSNYEFHCDRKKKIIFLNIFLNIFNHVTLKQCNMIKNN